MKKKKEMKEKAFENKVKNYLKSVGAYYVKYFGCAMSQAGVPDLLVCYKGQFIAIELKGEGGHPTPLQLLNLDKVKQAGGYAILLYPDQFEEFKLLIASINADVPKGIITKSFKFLR